MAPCVGAVDGSTLAVAVSVTTCVSILCVSLCVCAYGSGTCAQLCYWLNPQMRKAGLQWPGRITGLEWLEEMAMRSNST